MSESVAIDDLVNWRECRDCGLFQRLPEVRNGEAAICARCASVLRGGSTYSLLFARLNTVAAAILFALALALPLGELHIVGRTEVASLFSGPYMLRKDGLPLLAVVVVTTLVVMPAAKLVIELTVLFGICVAQPPRWLAWLFGWLEHISPWAMVEVFLLGSLVAYSRLEAIAVVDVGLSALALGGTMLAIVATDATLDYEAIWQRLAAGASPAERGSHLASARLIACTECRRVARSPAGHRCSRCGHRLSVRRGRLGTAWALLLAAAFLYIPANVLPVMTVKQMDRGVPMTILHGVVELAEHHLWPLALLVLVASVVIPIFKLLSVAILLVMTHRRSPSLLEGRTRLFRFVKFVGRWSMIDIFMLSVLVGVVRFGAIASILPGTGAVAFCAVVVLTMTVTELFDPRLMWDAAGRKEEAFERNKLEKDEELTHAAT